MIEEAIRENFQNREGVVLAVSGGIDSMVLLNAFADVSPCPVVVCHVDHQLRKDSSGDASFVRSESKRLNLPFQCVTISIPQNASVQASARTQRIAALRGVAFERGYRIVATAHHHDDWVEWFYIATASGAGMETLSQPVTSLIDNIEWLKPFTRIPQRVLKTHAINQKMSWREDPSNAQTDYTRNRIRAALKASVEEQGDGTAASRKRLEEDASLLWECVTDATQTNVERTSPWTVVVKNDGLSPNLRRSLYRNAAKQLGQTLSSQSVDAIEAHVGKRTRLTFHRLIAFVEKEAVTLHLNFGRGLEWYRELTSPASAEFTDGLTWFGGSFHIVEEKPRLKEDFFFPIDDFSDLSIRSYETDTYSISTLSKAVKSVPFADRWRIPILCRNAEPIWSPGLWSSETAPSNRYIVWRFEHGK